MRSNDKIVLVVGSLNQGGAEFQLLSLARLLQQRGHNVEVVALTDYHYFRPFVQQHNIVYRCVSNAGSNISRTLRAIRLINSRKPALVIAYIKKVSQVAIAARLLAGLRYKLIISERTSLIRPVHDRFYFRLATFADLVTVNAISKLHYIQHRFPFLTSKTVFVPNIIDLKKFNSINYMPRLNKKLHLSFVGRLSPEKNLLNLIRATASVMAKGYSLQLTLTGAGSNQAYVAELRELIASLNLQDAITIQPAVDDVTTIYREADFICLLSFFEGFSNVLSEAICSGIPVIASDIEENRYLVQEGQNGFLAAPHDVGSIAAAIERAICQPAEALAGISANNKKKAQSIFDEQSMYQLYANLFARIGFQPA